jgi:asparagine synthetase B (glutamine-hydrolysing)
MCGFIVTNLRDVDLTAANRFVQHRGPDQSNVVEVGEVRFLHNVLSITGDLTLQPFVSDGVACLHNGEIYNHTKFGEFPSDGYCLLPAYEEYGKYFVNELDGEFAIVLFDRLKKRIRLYTDVFGTKPMHYGVQDGQFAVASYASAISTLGFSKVEKIPANTLVEIGLEDGSLAIESGLFQFDLAQYKEDFNDWEAAFQASITKRTAHVSKQIFIGLSSGYDSGAIACELISQKVAFKSYSLLGIEDPSVLEQRLRIVSNHGEAEMIMPSYQELRNARQHIIDNIEELRFHIHSAGTGHVETPMLFQDGGAVGLSLICAHAKQECKKVYLSGQGADEIFSDYGFGGKRFYPHSNFGGLFPENLSEIFPWASFYGSSQAAYLGKEEYVAGSYGIETRYPFLDKWVVQEFLHLSCRLKNSAYKSVLDYYLRARNFPTLYDEKVGFVPKPASSAEST